MIALLDDVSVFHDKDRVGLADRGKPVGDDETRPSLHHTCERRLDPDLGAGIDAAGRLVQDQHRRETEHDAGDAQKLFLPLADVAAVLCDDGVIAVRQTADKAVGMGCLCRFYDLFFGGFRFSVGDIVPDGPGLQPGVLEHHSVIAPQRVACHLADIRSVHLDPSAVHIVEPHQKIDQRGLSAACRPDDRDPLSRFHVQGKVLDQRFVRHIAERHVLQRHMAVAGESSRVVGFRDLILLVHQVEDTGGAGQGVLEFRDDA